MSIEFTKLQAKWWASRFRAGNNFKHLSLDLIAIVVFALTLTISFGKAYW